MDALTYLGAITLLFLVGLVSTLLSTKLKISNVLLLVLSGVVLRLLFKETVVIAFPPVFISCVSIIALSLIVFDGASRFKFKEFDSFSFRALKLFTIFLGLDLLILTPIVMLFFNLSLLSALIFSVLMAATAFEVLTFMVKKSRTRTIELLELESLVNAPFTVLIPFMLIDFFSKGKIISLSDSMQYLVPFTQQIIIGVGTGVLIGVIIFKLMRYKYSESLSPIALITSVLLTYILSEELGGSGVLAVTVLGLFFGNMYVKNKPSLQEFSGTMSSSVEILIFLLFGMIIKFPHTLVFFVKSLLLFLLYLLVRLLAVQFSVPNYSVGEKSFLTFVTPKGITLAAVALTISTFAYDFSSMITLLFLMFFYSLILSIVITRISVRFLDKNVSKVMK